MGPRSPGHQTRGCSTGLSLENTTLETGAEREGIQRNTTTAGSGKELGSNSTARPGGTRFLLPRGVPPPWLWPSWLSAMVFPLEEFHSV